MDVDLTAGIVRILKPDGSTAGTGFVVSDKGLIATCAHVVQYARAGPGGMVCVVFRASGEAGEAEVRPEYWRGPDAEDVAVLRLENLPAGVIPLLLGSSGGTCTHPFKAFGFPEAKGTEGMWGYGCLGDKTTEGGYPVLQLTGTTEVTVGFSGGPVLDTVTRRVVGMVTSITRPDEYGRLTETAFIIPSETLREISPPLCLSDLCPYRGLSAFTGTDAEFFFGREKLVADLVSQLRRSPRLLAVIGPSGSGKSSVIQAGLLPALRRGDVPGSQDWDLLTFRPGAEPFAALASAGLHTETAIELQEALRAYLAEHPAASRLVIFADQFEGLFALCPEIVRTRFLGQLLALLDSNLPVTLILALRADFYGRLLSQRALSEWLALGQVNVLPMDEAELQAAVEEPAHKVGLCFESGLAVTIVEEASQIEHALPLLEAALTQLWEQREEGMLTHAAYQQVGQVAGAISQWADDTYSGLDEEEKPLAQRVFTRLLHYGEGETADTRQTKPLSELVTRPQELETVHRLVQRLADTRLLVTDRDPRTGEETAEIIHDALLWEWRRLRLWVQEQRAFYLWRQRLDERLEEWKDKGQDEGALLRGALLNEAEPWLSSKPDALNPEERRYIQDSVALQEREKAARERLRRRIILGLAIGLVVTFVLAAVAWGQRNSALRSQETAVAEAYSRATAQLQAEAAQATAVKEADIRATAQVQAEEAEATAVVEAQVRATAQALAEDQRKRAEQQARLALSRQLATQSQAVLETYPQRSLLLAVEALNITLQAGEPRTPAAEDALRQALANTGGRVLTAHRDSVTEIAISPDGHYLVTAGRDNTARLWDLTSPNPADAPIVLEGHENFITAIAISPNNHWLVTGSVDHTARLWDLTAPDPAAAPIVLPRHESSIFAVAISPDSHWLVTSSVDNTGRARLWDLTAPNPAATPVVLDGHEGGIDVVAISPDGHWLVTGSRDNTACLWDLTAKDPASAPIVLRGQNDSIAAVAISPDNHWLVTSSRNRIACLWDLTAPDPAAAPIILRGHEGGIWAVAISPDNRWLATGSGDNTARLWNLTAPDPAAAPIVLHGHEGWIEAVAFSSDKHWLVTGSRDNTARLWDLTAPDPAAAPIVLRGHEGYIGEVAISPDSHWLATGSGDNTARLWDLTAHNLAAAPIVLAANEAGIRAIAVSPNSHWIVAATDDATAYLWDVTSLDSTTTPIVLRGHDDGTTAVVISPDSHWLLSGTEDGTAWLRDVSALLNIDLTVGDVADKPIALHGHEGWVNAIATSRDSHWLVTGSNDDTARLWDLTVSNPGAAPTVLAGHTDAILAVAISPDNHWLATASYDKTALLWNLSALLKAGLTAPDPAAESIALSGHRSSVKAVTFSSDNRWLVTGSNDNTARLWDLTSPNPSTEPIVLLGGGPENIPPEAKGWIIAIAISPDNHWLVTSSWDGTLRLWDLTAPNPSANPGVFRGHEHLITAVAISPDNHWLVTGSKDNTARLWDLTAEDPASAPIVLRGHEGAIVAAAISPDNHWLVTGSEDATARLWNLRLDELIDLGCRVAGRNLTRAEWQLYFGEEAYRPTCPDLPMPEQ